MNPGTIDTNIEKVLEAVKEKSRQYQDITKYQGDDKQAKEDRALLRKQKDMTKTTIASIQKLWNEPLEKFLTGGKEILKQFDIAIGTIDEWVKEGEAEEKEKKRSEIQIYFDGKNFDLVPLVKLFDGRWLNKTYKMPDIRQDIDAAISTIYSNIKILEGIAEHGVMAKAFYLETLDMGSAMRKVDELKAAAERLAREKVEREERERQVQIIKNATMERQEEKETAKEERIKSLAGEALEITEPETTVPEVMEYTLRFKGTKEQLLKLREYMTANGITYERIV
jgi:hypothetical protein